MNRRWSNIDFYQDASFHDVHDADECVHCPIATYWNEEEYTNVQYCHLGVLSWSCVSTRTWFVVLLNNYGAGVAFCPVAPYNDALRLYLLDIDNVATSLHRAVVDRCCGWDYVCHFAMMTLI